MDRRAFLGTMLGGVAAAATVRTWPFRVYSFPAETMTVPQAIRFIRAYDITQDRFVTRFDVLYGWMQLDNPPTMKLELPKGIEQAELIRAKPGEFLSNRELKRFTERCVERYGLTVPADAIVTSLENRSGQWLTTEMQRGCDAF